MLYFIVRRIENCQWRRGAAVRGNPHDDAGRLPKDDHSIAVPRTTDGEAAQIA